jgi:hypothetical protein
MYQGIAFDTHGRIDAMSIKELSAQLQERSREIAQQLEAAVEERRNVVERA